MKRSNKKFFPENNRPPFDMVCESAAAGSSWYWFSRFRLAFDCGSSPDFMAGVRHLVLSHAHMDHIAGLFPLVSRKNLLKTEPLSVYGPSWGKEEIFQIFHSFEKLNASDGWEWNWVDFDPGTTISMGKNRFLRSFEAYHRHPAISVLFFETKKRLKDQYLDEEKRKMASLAGEEVCEEIEVPKIFYSGDTDGKILENPYLFSSELAILESTFLDPDHRQRAEAHAHLHFEEILAVSKKFQNKDLVLTHFSSRYSRQDILSYGKVLREKLDQSVNLWMNTPRDGLILVGK